MSTAADRFLDISPPLPLAARRAAAAWCPPSASSGRWASESQGICVGELAVRVKATGLEAHGADALAS